MDGPRAFLRGPPFFAAPAASAQGKPESKPASRPSSESKPAGEHKALAIGDPAPAFSVKDQTGKLRTLAEFKGKRVMLYFYPKADTPG